MQSYETNDTYSAAQIKVLTDWFDKNIGTDYEVNESASGLEDEYYVVFVDLTVKEVEMLRDYENNLLNNIAQSLQDDKERYEGDNYDECR